MDDKAPQNHYLGDTPKGVSAPGSFGVIDPITPEMVVAGIYALREFWLGSDPGEIAKAVYMAMEYERRDSKGFGLGD